MTPAQFENLLKRFVAFCRQEFGYDLYAYQLRVARACLHSLFVEPRDVFIRVSRQSGKTECLTLLVRFFIIFHRALSGRPLMCAIASPKGEQAKTDLDRSSRTAGRWRTGSSTPSPSAPTGTGLPHGRYRSL